MSATQNHSNLDSDELRALSHKIKMWGAALGFQQVGITDTDLTEAEQHLCNWLDNNYQGEMHWMAQHGSKRSRPAELIPDTLRIISVRMDYLPAETGRPEDSLQSNEQAYISRYALGRDYHKLLRKRLQQLAQQIENEIGPFGYRVFVDSAPVLEKALAEKAGLGWIGKHSNLIHKDTGSWFFLGEIYTDLPLPVDSPATDHCGTCQSCIDICPTQAIVAPYIVDARRCISYLTIELRSTIPLEFRPLLGNRIYGCDDCQLVCPWNRFAHTTQEADFQPRQQLDSITLLNLFAWDEETFLTKTEGSPIRRIGHECWLRNIAVALGNARGNADTEPAIITALQNRLGHASALVREHVEWALQQHNKTA